jgi:phosphate acetyltransferase
MLCLKVNFLAYPAVKEVVEELNGKILFMNNFLIQLGSYITGKMQLHYHIRKNAPDNA